MENSVFVLALDMSLEEVGPHSRVDGCVDVVYDNRDQAIVIEIRHIDYVIVVCDRREDRHDEV
jgi:ribosomal protein L21E